MYKVIIVDDEIFVLTLIEKIVDWQKLNMTIIGKCNDGVEALNLIIKLEPDIVIVDVRMPGYDGITLMQKVREVNNNIKFIVISGHKRFEYAKSAMKYNVEDYILKPISKKELESILLKLKNKLDEEQENRNAIERIDNQLGVSTSKVRSYFMTQFLKREIRFEDILLADINSNYYTNFKDDSYSISILKLDTNYKMVDKGFFSNLLHKIADKFVENIKSYCHDILYEVMKCKIVIFINFDPRNKEQLYNAMEKEFEQRKQELEKFNNIFITLCLGDDVKEAGMVYQSLDKAEAIEKSRISLGVNKIINYNKIKEDPGIFRSIMSDKRREDILTAIKSFNVEKIRSNVLDAFNAANEYKNESSLIYYKLCDEINVIFYDYINQIELYKESYDDLRQKLYDQLEWCYTERELANVLINHLNEFIKLYVAESDSNENPVVRISKRYIVENYVNSITLASISKIINLSPVYFSILFKKETGINFIDYLNQYRVDVAKKILKDVRYNINEVALLSGYQDPRYFSKIFKKIIGITPTDYRNRHIK